MRWGSVLLTPGASGSGALPSASGQVAGALARPLGAAARRRVGDDVRGWLAWNHGLTGWRPQTSAVDAVPFVALYARGMLRGCMGSSDGEPGQRLARAFLSASTDVRFGGVRAADRATLTADVSFMRSPRLVDESTLLSDLELGTHGIGLLRDDGGPVFLLPTVARDSRLDARGMLGALHRKAGPAPGSLFLFDADTVVVRRDRPTRTSRALSPRAAAVAWLTSLMRPDGSILFAIDARTGASSDVGAMHHARGASVVHALATAGGRPKLLARARERLVVDIRSALEGHAVPGWPKSPAEVAGTLAHAVRAGIPLREETLAYVALHQEAIARVPWHAAQTVAALGLEAPPVLWTACEQSLAKTPWAPWTVLAMKARGVPVPAAREAVGGLVNAVRSSPPYVGGVMGAAIPEVAITALTVEALLAYPSVKGAREAAARARAFLMRHQLLRDTTPACFDPSTTEGAFVAAPAATLLRGDVTAHALLAME